MASKARRRVDPLSFGGMVLAVACVLGGLVLENGDVRDVAQITAAVIVLGGTVGAVIVSASKERLLNAVQRGFRVMWETPASPGEVLDEIAHFSAKARRKGLAGLDDRQVKAVEYPLLRKGLLFAMDEVEPSAVREALETEIAIQEREADSCARIWESAGGFAPTFGIIGAVLGLIQVMKHLENLDNVGRGIAVSFVATVYGIGLANLFFFPIAQKIRNRAEADAHVNELIRDGVTAIQHATNPKLIRRLLDCYTDGQHGDLEVMVSHGPEAVPEQSASVG